MNEIQMRWIERLLIDFGAIVIAILGYRLFVIGSSKLEGKSSLKLSSKVFTLVFSGTAPGLFLILAGTFLLAMSLMKGMSASTSNSTQTGHVDYMTKP